MKTTITLLALLATAAVARSETPIEQAVAAIRSGDLAAAESLLVPLTQATPPDAAAFHQLSIVRLSQKRTKDAVEAAEKAAELKPDSADHHAQLGIALATRMGEVGFMQQAMMSAKLKQSFERAVELDPNNVQGLIGMSRFYTNAPEIAGGSLVKAVEFAGRVKTLDPFLGELELGRISERGEKLDAALAHYEAATALRPDSAGATFACGRVLAKLGRTGDARARFEQALKINPEFEAAKKGLADLSAPAS